MTVPGIGPIISSANRRPDDPRTHLLARQQLPAHALHPNSPGHSGAAGELAKHGFGAWLVRVIQRLHPNVLAAALANKLARIAWTVLAQERSYEARVTKAEA